MELLLPDYPAVRRLLTAAAKTPVTTVLLGETGVGKEYVADMIHKSSARASRPFVKFNCVGFAENVVDSELFGHVRGAFTGATENRIGLLEQANFGTLLIDEIGDMPMLLQAKLLRFLQDGEVRPVGSNQTRHVDARVLFATRRNLEELVKAGTFRDDLYYRIADLCITIPPLRSRPSEIPALASAFVAQANRDYKANVPEMTATDVAVMLRMSWPGNVRELRSYCRRHVLEGQGFAA